MTLRNYIFPVLLSAVLVGCGGDEKKADEKEKVTIGTKQEASKKDESVINLALAADDQMKYDKKELRVKAGQEVTLTLRHTGKIDKKVMGHNFVLLKQGINIPAFAANAAAAGEAEDWIPEDGKDIIAYTKMLGGGETTSITFTAPEAGTYDFVCSFPGHYTLMQGKFIVE